jgi:hypothetical protein
MNAEDGGFAMKHKNVLVCIYIVTILLTYAGVEAAVTAGDIAITGHFMNQEGQGLTAADLANALVGQGVQISNVKSNCADYAAGTYAVTGDVGIGMPMGIILSTGLIYNVIGPNKYAGISANNRKGGDADLNALIPGKNTLDACVLEFDFVPQNPNISFTYVFASEEYNEYVGSQYNDVFGFFIDGVNCATINESNVSVNSINNTVNSGLFIDNTLPAYNIEMDGFTRVLTCSSAVTAGTTHHLKLAIADAGDSALDSNVFIGSQSLVSAQYGVTLTPDNQQHMASCGSTTSYELELQNTGGIADSFSLTLSGNVWSSLFDATGTSAMTIGPLDPLATARFSVTVSVPADVCTGHDAAAVISTSAGSPGVFAQSTLASTADSKRVLTVAVTSVNNGSGTVTSSSPASPTIVCPGTCTANYPYGTSVVLSAYPAWHSTAIWVGCTAVGNDCTLQMNSDFNLSAEFFPLLTVLRSGSAISEHNTIQSAYEVSVTGDTIQSQAHTYFEDLVLNRPVEVVLQGGVDSGYQPTPGYTYIDGSVKISGGKVWFDRVVIR